MRKKAAPKSAYTSAYDPEKDVVLYRQTAETDQQNMLEASVRSYNGGDPRLQLGRYYRRDGRESWRYFAIRRMSLNDGRTLMALTERVLKDAEAAVKAGEAARAA